MLTIVRRNSRLNCMLKKELRRYEQRSRFPNKSPFRAHFRAFYPHPANKSALRAEGASHFRASGKRGWPAMSPRPLICRDSLLLPLATVLSLRAPDQTTGRELGLFSGSIPPWFVLSNDLSTTNTRAIWLCLGAFLSPPASSVQFHWPLATDHHSPVPRSTPEPAGSGHAQTLPHGYTA